MALDPNPLGLYTSTGQPAPSSGGTVTLQRGVAYDIELAFQQNDATMPVTPILEVIGPDGSIAYLQGVQASVQGGQETITVSGFKPEETGTYTVKAFTWSTWLDEGGVPVGEPYWLTVKAQ